MTPSYAENRGHLGKKGSFIVNTSPLPQEILDQEKVPRKVKMDPRPVKQLLQKHRQAKN